MAANNVLAHVPDIHDFVAGFRILLKPEGVATFEFPHLLRMIEQRQFDTIYHEHFSYLSLGVVAGILERARPAGLRRGGTGRPMAARCGSSSATRRPPTPQGPAVARVLAAERAGGPVRRERLRRASRRTWSRIKCATLAFLRGAAADGEDRLRLRRGGQGQHLPELLRHRSRAGARPWPTARRTSRARSCRAAASRWSRRRPCWRLRPDYVLILPWNLKDEIAGEMAAIRDWGGRFVTAIPRLAVF